MKFMHVLPLAVSLGAVSTLLHAQAATPAPAAPAAKPAASVPYVFPAPRLVPGQSIDTRPPELSTDKPAFAGQTRAPYEPSAPFNVVTVTDQLRAPWSMAFLPGGKMLVTEKPGAMRIVDAAGNVSEPLRNVPKVYYSQQVGLLDLALDKDFARNHRIFFSFCELVGEKMTNIAIASATLDEAGGALADVRVIFRALPALPSSNAGNAGGRLAVGRDGNLFMTVGDRSQMAIWDKAQRLDTHLGKIVRVTPEGRPAPGNPFLRTPGALPEIYSLGHRSEQGLAFDTRGQLWETEHGARGGDELNAIRSGGNYGWPVIAHGINYYGDLINGGLTEKAGMEQPRYYWSPVIAPSGLAFYKGNMFPRWRNSVFVGGLHGTMLARLSLQGQKVVGEEPLMFDLKNRVRDVRIAPDGAVYVLTDDGKMLKLVPK